MRKLVLFSKIKQKKITFDVTMDPQFLPQENNNENSEYSSPLKEEGTVLEQRSSGEADGFNLLYQVQPSSG